jgi:hypothetical protein
VEVYGISRREAGEVRKSVDQQVRRSAGQKIRRSEDQQFRRSEDPKVNLIQALTHCPLNTVH